jgi:hypothetical protein
MKNLIFLLILLPGICVGQSVNWFEKESFFFVSTEVDARNIIFGSAVNKPSYDGLLNIGYRNQGFQVQASYENFRAIDFYSLEFRAGHVFNHDGVWNYTLLGGLGWIQRNVDWIQKRLHLSASISGQLEYHFYSFFFFVRGEGRLRTDLEKLKASGYAGIGYKF